jgi:DHA1 family tetracycline resistance protein-like MFS transporter
MPSIRAIMSRAVPPNAQGELQGAIGGIVSFTAIVTPFTMTHLFAAATSPASPVQLPGAPFAAAAVALVVGALLFSRIAGVVNAAGPQRAGAAAASAPR